MFLYNIKHKLETVEDYQDKLFLKGNPYKRRKEMPIMVFVFKSSVVHPI